MLIYVDQQRCYPSFPWLFHVKCLSKRRLRKETFLWFRVSDSFAFRVDFVYLNCCDRNERRLSSLLRYRFNQIFCMTLRYEEQRQCKNKVTYHWVKWRLNCSRVDVVTPTSAHCFIVSCMFCAVCIFVFNYSIFSKIYTFTQH